jgi:integrase
LNPQLAPILRAWKESCPPTNEGFVFPAPPPTARGKLSRAQLVELRTRAAAGATCAQLARAFDVSWNAVKKILRDETRGSETSASAGMRSKDSDDAFHEALAGAGVRRIRFHDLRHTFASHFVMAGGGILTLQKLRGHHTAPCKFNSIH